MFLSLEILEQRRLRLDLYFAYKLFLGNIDCPDFVIHFSFHTPTRNTGRKIHLIYVQQIQHFEIGYLKKYFF